MAQRSFRFPKSGYRSWYAAKPARRYKAKYRGVSKYRTRYNSQFGTFSKIGKANPRAVAQKEMKYYDDNALIAGGLGQYATNWSAYYLPAIIKGTGATNRIGDQIYAEWLSIKLQVNHTAAGAVNQRVRWMVLQQYDPFGGAPVPAEVFQTPLMFSPHRSIDYLHSYKVLAEGQVILELQTHSAEVIEIQRPLKFVIKFSANAGVVADVSRNNVAFVAWSDQAANPPAMANGAWRISFRDM